MIEGLNEIRKNEIISNLVLLVVGIILTIWPDETLNIAVNLVGSVIIIFGIVSLVMGLKNKGNDYLSLFIGILAIIVGIFVIIKSSTVISIIHILLGIKKDDAKEKSFSRSQVLFQDYYGYNIPIILYETCNILARTLRNNKVRTSLIGLGIKYNKHIGGGFYHSMKIDDKLDNENKIYDYVMYMFDKYYKNNYPIRMINISVGKLSSNNEYQINIFEDFDKLKEEKNMDIAIDQIKDRFGPNSLLKGSSLLSDSTIRERNGKIGGHRA